MRCSSITDGCSPVIISDRSSDDRGIQVAGLASHGLISANRSGRGSFGISIISFTLRIEILVRFRVTVSGPNSVFRLYGGGRCSLRVGRNVGALTATCCPAKRGRHFGTFTGSPNGMSVGGIRARRVAKRVGRNSGLGLLLDAPINGDGGRCNLRACNHLISSPVRPQDAVVVMARLCDCLGAAVCHSEVSCHGRVSRLAQLSQQSIGVLAQNATEKAMLIARTSPAQITFFGTVPCTGLCGGVIGAVLVAVARVRMALLVFISISSGPTSGRPAISGNGMGRTKNGLEV